MSTDRDEVRRQFADAVDMSAEELERWLATEESQAVGQHRAGESVGQESGRRIVALPAHRGGRRRTGATTRSPTDRGRGRRG